MFLEEGEKMLESCLLPECIYDITENPLDGNQFIEYREHLKHVLPTLFDLISSRELELFDVIPETLKFRRLFVEFVCEQRGDCDLFRTDVDNLVKNLVSCEGKLKKILQSDKDLRKEMFVVYKSKLLGQAWKKHLGAIHGFLCFCRTSFEGDATETLDLDKEMFILSIGTQFLENVDPSFKLCGLKLFCLLLECSNEDSLIETNTHCVIYSQAMDNIQKLLNEECSRAIWKCIWLAVSKDKTLARDPEWNKLDDCLNILIYRLKIESQPSTKRFLKETLLRFVSFSVVADKREIGVDLNNLSAQNLNELLDELLKSKGATIDNFKCYRWAKNLLDLFVVQLLTIASTRQGVVSTIQFIHTVYLLTIAAIRRDLLDDILKQFIKRVMPICAEILNIYHTADNVQKSTASFLETVYNQVQEKSQGNNYVSALGSFLTHLKDQRPTP
ncbi:uncharacterized protein LOC129797835 [Lutzomyia longipalpis]|uniref:uncharacterized protein LOC129797835 n=1 Tax=Lutzomyia longipalpis TaxID=7200 RepID=UPI002483D5BA|nr:uncharacterized protein LOC129797835 [Lutzomyia longipalpis]